MKPFTFIIACFTYSVLAAHVQQIRTMVAKPFNAKEARAFLDCVSASPEPYKVKVKEGGTILVKPSSPRSLDRNGKDKTLFDCMEKCAGMLRTAAESSPYSREETALLKSLSSVTAEELGDMGASGQALVSVSEETFSKRKTARTVLLSNSIQFTHEARRDEFHTMYR